MGGKELGENGAGGWGDNRLVGDGGMCVGDDDARRGEVWGVGRRGDRSRGKGKGGAGRVGEGRGGESRGDKGRGGEGRAGEGRGVKGWGSEGRGGEGGGGDGKGGDGAIKHVPVTRPSDRTASGFVTVAASIVVNLRTAETLVVAPRLSVAVEGQTSSMTAVDMEASMEIVAAAPALTIMLSARLAVMVMVVPTFAQETRT